MNKFDDNLFDVATGLTGPINIGVAGNTPSFTLYSLDLNGNVMTDMQINTTLPKGQV